MELTAFAAWLNAAFAGFDNAISSAALSLQPSMDWLFQPLSLLMHYLGAGGAALIALSVVLMLFRRTRRVGTVMLLALGVGALITNLGLKPTVARPRPYLDEGSVFHQLWLLSGGHTESDFSFPSGHTTAATAAMVGLFLATPKSKSWPALIFALLMGFSRIYLGVHYPSDVLFGFVCGAVGAIAAYYIARPIPQVYYDFELFRKRK